MPFGRKPNLWPVLCITRERGSWTSNLGLPFFFFNVSRPVLQNISALCNIICFSFHYNYTSWRQWTLECHNFSWRLCLLIVRRYIYGLLKFNNSNTLFFYSSPNIVRVIKSRRMRWTGYVARMGKKRGVYRILLGKPEGRRLRRRWVDNIRMDLQ